MKKLVVMAAAVSAIALMTGLAPDANASISLTIKNSFGLEYPAPGTWLPAGATVQLVWDDGDQTYATPGDGAIPGDGAQYSDGDYVLFQTAAPEDGGWGYSVLDLDGNTKYYNTDVGGLNINSGYVYLYVFQDSSPAPGEFYARSSMVGSLKDAENPLNTPDAIDMAPSSAVVLDTFQVVPEPGTIGLFAMGLLPIIFRRFRRK